MAQPIPFVPSPTPPEQGAEERLRHASAQNAEGLISALQLLQALHQRGVLDLLRGLAGAGDHVVNALTEALNTPEAIQGMRNFLLLTRFFASIPPEVLQSMEQAVETGAARKKSREAPSLFQLLRRLKNEDTRHALSVMLDLAESLGRGL